MKLHQFVARNHLTSVEDAVEYVKAAVAENNNQELLIKVIRDDLGWCPNAFFQDRVKPWMLACFGQEIADDTVERNHRFIEEALELVQCLGMPEEDAHQLVKYVYNRPQGEPVQEVGGVMVTLAALCLANRLDMHEAGEIELDRILHPDVMAKIRAKQASKPKGSPLAEGSTS
jgi:hypothetical protein